MDTSTQGTTRREDILKRMEDIDAEIKIIQSEGVGNDAWKWDNALSIKGLEKEWIDLDDQLQTLAENR